MTAAIETNQKKFRHRPARSHSKAFWTARPGSGVAVLDEHVKVARIDIDALIAQSGKPFCDFARFMPPMSDKVVTDRKSWPTVKTASSDQLLFPTYPYSGIRVSEPPSSLGKSLCFGSPSLIGSTVS